MKIKLKHCDHMGDWYTIVRAEHSGHEWWERTGPNSLRYMSSERLSPEACIEGPGYEMLAVAEAIKARGEVSFRRVEVRHEADGFHFRSPKNSERDAVVSVEDADELAQSICAAMKPNAGATRPAEGRSG